VNAALGFWVEIEKPPENPGGRYDRKEMLAVTQTPDADPAPPGVHMAMVIRSEFSKCIKFCEP
jgi:hypothetical protein